MKFPPACHNLGEELGRNSVASIDDRAQDRRHRNQYLRLRRGVADGLEPASVLYRRSSRRASKRREAGTMQLHLICPLTLRHEIVAEDRARIINLRAGFTQPSAAPMVPASKKADCKRCSMTATCFRGISSIAHAIATDYLKRPMGWNREVRDGFGLPARSGFGASGPDKVLRSSHLQNSTRWVGTKSSGLSPEACCRSKY